MVKTMKSLAAVNIRQFEGAVESLEEYRSVVDLGWTVFLRMGRPAVYPPKNEGNVCLVVGSDQGMCGQFNESLWPFAQEQVKAETAPGGKWNYWSVGEKIHGMLVDAGVASDVHFPAPGSLNAVTQRVQENHWSGGGTPFKQNPQNALSLPSRGRRSGRIRAGFSKGVAVGYVLG